MTRTQFPVVAGFAITLAGSKRFHPAAKHGLPFVAFTRSESFAMTAFKNIPAWNDFVKGKESEMLRSRRAFTERIQKLHERTLAEHSTMGSLEEEEAAQADWDGEQAQRPKR